MAKGPTQNGWIVTRPVTIPGETGPLDGVWNRPAAADAALLMAHGAGAGMEHPNFEQLVRELNVRRIACLRFQFPFMQKRLARHAAGPVDARPARTFGPVDHPDVAVRAIAAAWRKLKSLDDGLPRFAAGHSFGARMVSLADAQGQLKNCQGLIFASYPLHPPGKPSLNRAAHWSEIRTPVLFLSGTRDRMIDQSLLEQAATRFDVGCEVRWLDAVDHGYAVRKRIRSDSRSVFEEMADTIRCWIDHFE